MVPYRPSPAASSADQPWALARRGLLLTGGAYVAMVTSYVVELGVLAGSDDGLGLRLVPASISLRVALHWVAAAGVLLFSRGIARLGPPRLARAAAAALATSSLAATIEAVAVMNPWVAGVLTLRPFLVRAATVVSVFGMPAFLGAAWRVEYSMRSRSTGWTWALAGAAVVSVGAWRLWVPVAPSIRASVERARAAPLASTVALAVLVAATLLVALPCLRLRRRLATALPDAPEAPSHPVLAAFQLHAAALEAKVALAIGLATIGCVGFAGDLLHHPNASCWTGNASFSMFTGWELLLASGDAAIDLLAVLGARRFVREARGAQWLILGLILRTPLLVGSGPRAATMLFVTLASGVVFSLLGHLALAAWLRGQVASQCALRAGTAGSYAHATSWLVAALSVFAVATLFLLGHGYYVVLAGPTAIVAARLLRGHEQESLAILSEAEKARAR
ncbi:MAG: hypothetical protein ABSE49_30110 [Polyangiaceae bacterium]